MLAARAECPGEHVCVRVCGRLCLCLLAGHAAAALALMKSLVAEPRREPENAILAPLLRVAQKYQEISLKQNVLGKHFSSIS